MHKKSKSMLQNSHLMLHAKIGKARLSGKDINVPAPPEATRMNAGEIVYYTMELDCQKL